MASQDLAGLEDDRVCTVYDKEMEMKKVEQQIKDEYDALRSQTAMSKRSKGGRLKGADLKNSILTAYQEVILGLQKWLVRIPQDLRVTVSKLLRERFLLGRLQQRSQVNE
jgi:succinyl-CoA synthetase beta subunit